MTVLGKDLVILFVLTGNIGSLHLGDTGTGNLNSNLLGVIPALGIAGGDLCFFHGDHQVCLCLVTADGAGIGQRIGAHSVKGVGAIGHSRFHTILGYLGQGITLGDDFLSLVHIGDLDLADFRRLTHLVEGFAGNSQGLGDTRLNTIHSIRGRNRTIYILFEFNRLVCDSHQRSRALCIQIARIRIRKVNGLIAGTTLHRDGTIGGNMIHSRIRASFTSVVMAPEEDDITIDGSIITHCNLIQSGSPVGRAIVIVTTLVQRIVRQHNDDLAGIDSTAVSPCDKVISLSFGVNTADGTGNTALRNTVDIVVFTLVDLCAAATVGQNDASIIGDIHVMNTGNNVHVGSIQTGCCIHHLA